MWATILSIINVALQASTKLLEYLAAEKLRQDGRNEQRLADLEQVLKDIQIAKEIDSKPVPDSKPAILSRL